MVPISDRKLLGFLEDWNVEVECVEPVWKVFALLGDLFASRAEGKEALWDASMVVVVEVDVNAIVNIKYQVVDQVSDVAWKFEKETSIVRLL